MDGVPSFRSFYYKRTVQAVKTDENGVRIGYTRGMAYIMHEERKLGTPSMQYFDILYNAYWRFGFDENILGDAYEYSWQPPEEYPEESLPCLW